MHSNYKLKSYYSERTVKLIEERTNIASISYGRKNKNKKIRILIFKDIQIYLNKFIDFISTSIKNPVSFVFLTLSIGLASFIISSSVIDSKFDHKFFKSMENDPTIPKEIMLRVQNHYYNNK